MEKLDEAYWTRRYETDDFGWDVGAITRPIKEYIDQLKDKSVRILIPGAGNSYEAEYLYNKGFHHVVVADLSAVPLDNIKKRVPDFPAEQLQQINFFDLEDEFDLIVEQTFFCALDPALRASYVRKMHSLLKPEGKLVGLLFDAALNTDHPPFGGSREEYGKLFRPYFDFGTFESCYNSIEPRKGRELFIILKKKGLSPD